MAGPFKLSGTANSWICGWVCLCSPTRWAPLFRGVAGLKAQDTHGFLRQGVVEALGDVRLDANALVTGKLQSSPFTDEVLQKVRGKIAGLFRDPDDALVRDVGQPFFLRLLAQWLEVFGDPGVFRKEEALEADAVDLVVGL
eukprot:s1069_g1.t1